MSLAHLEVLIRLEPHVGGGLFFPANKEELCKINFNKWVLLPTAPIPGVTYWWKGAAIQAEKVSFCIEDWEIVTPTRDLSQEIIRSDEELQRHLLRIWLQEGWEFGTGEWGDSVKKYIRQHSGFWDQHRQRLEQFIQTTMAYRAASITHIGYWWSKAFDRLLRSSISEARALWDQMPPEERAKMPESYRIAYKRNCL